MFRTDDRSVLRAAGWQRYPWLVHGFSTRKTGDFLQWPRDVEIAAAFGGGSARTATLRQVHSGRYVRADRAWSGTRPEADAVLTDRPGVLAGVRTADCVPVLLVDPVRRAVAAVHAGWRGTVAGVLPHAVRGMEEEYGSSPGEVEAAIGPCIGACCFEVGDEVAARFHERFVDRRRERPHVDLTSTLMDQLRTAGVKRILACRTCTSCDTGSYFSHRAERGRAGRMLAVVGIRAEGPA